MRNISLASVGFLSILLASCLKDKNISNQVYGMAGAEDTDLVEFPASSRTVDLLDHPRDTTINLAIVRLNSETPAQEDIQVTLAPDNSLVTAAGLTIPPATLYTMSNLTVTIPKGQQQGALTLTTRAANMVQGNYGFGFRIASTSNPKYLISRNNTVLVTVPVRNRYDGNYSLRINTVGWGAFGISDGVARDWPVNANGTSIGMVTAGLSSVRMFMYRPPGAFVQVGFTSTGDLTTFGATAPRFTFDRSTDRLTSVTNDAPPDSRNRAFRINPAVNDSRWEQLPNGDRVIYAAYILSQTGRPDMYIYDTLRYRGLRP